MAAPMGAGRAEAERRHRARALKRDMRIFDSAANATGAAIAFVLLVLLDAGQRVPLDRRWEVAGLSVALVLVGTAVAFVVMEHQGQPLITALEDGRPLEGAARRALFSLPMHCASISTLIWFGASVLCAAEASLRLGNGAVASVQFSCVVALSGLTTGLVVYLVSERRLRPLMAEAFDHAEPDESETVRASLRLVMVWALGSGVPILIAALVLLDTSASRARLRAEVLPWLLLGFGIGGLTMLRAAGGLMESLDELREAQAKVRTGDLTARSPVDDASEVGLLQAGFNQMVEGLRDRERVRDLFGRHVGEGVARRAIEHGAALGGEVVDASALFVDVCDSTELAFTMPPAMVVALLNDLFTAVVAATDANGGWLNKFEGDAALCVFGPPLGCGDHAASALRAARQLRGAVDLLALRHPRLQVGVGVSSGQVFAGNVGTEQRFEYTIIGDAVNEAARLSQLAKSSPGGVLASDAAVDAAGSEVGAWVPAGEEHLRGRAAATVVWTPAPGRSRSGRDRGGSLLGAASDLPLSARGVGLEPTTR
ncbi:MAG: adenylate cyclase [Acidimicrobiales bacterium]|nr:adenylate cyclase [Acidimicrobiales bacterium]